MGASSAVAQPPNLIDYDQQIQPLWNRYCIDCHNPTANEGELSLIDYASFAKGDDALQLVTKGSANASRLFQLMTGLDEPQMPPMDSPQLTKEELEVIRLWLDQGAHGVSTSLPLADRLKTPVIPRRIASPLPITALTVRPSDQQLLIGGSQFVDLLRSEPVKNQAEGLIGKVSQIRCSSDGQRLLVVSGLPGVGGQVSVLDSRTFLRLHAWEIGTDLLYTGAFSPNGEWIAVAGYDRIVRLLNANTGEVVRELLGHHGCVYDLAFHPSGNCLATASADETIKLWHVPSGERLDTFPQGEGAQYQVQFTPDGKYIVAGGEDRRVRLWRVESTETAMLNPLVQSVYAHEGSIIAMSLPSDGSWLATAGDDRKIKAWSLPDLQPLGELASLTEAPTCMTIDAQQVVWFADATGKVHSAPKPHLPSPSRERATIASPKPAPSSLSKQAHWVQEAEPNNTPKQASLLKLPTTVQGRIEAPSANLQADEDWYAFQAKAGEEWCIEIHSPKSNSQLDSHLEITDAAGRPLLRTRLQAIRESYFTFRGKGSDGVDDFRLHNWQDMELNEYLYAGGEVVKLWLYPRGPDSGFKVYPGYGNRYNYWDTTATAHALGEPAWIVRPLADGQPPIPNGLPVFPIYYENDDDPRRKHGKDSRLRFVAPSDEKYCIRVRDARGQGGEEYSYQLVVRQPQPDFEVQINTSELALVPGHGREFEISVVRLDGFEGPLDIHFTNLPAGFIATQPLTIEAGQDKALGTLFWPANDSESRDTVSIDLVAKAQLAAATIERPFAKPLVLKKASGSRVAFQVVKSDAPIPQATRSVEAASNATNREATGTSTLEIAKPLELVIHPGETISAKIIADRGTFQGDIGFGNEDSGRNLPHGVIVGNIGLSGLLIPAGQTQQEFFPHRRPLDSAPKAAFPFASQHRWQPNHPSDLADRRVPEER